MDSINKKADRRLFIWLFFLASACYLLFHNLGCRALWGSEGRWAEVVRQMFLTKDFFHPSINGEPYFDKPLFTYWVIAIMAQGLGKLNELVARLPSAISALVSLCCVYWLGKRLWDEKSGLIATFFMLTSFGFVFWARTAAADTENLCFILISICWYIYFEKKADFFSYAGFYLICAVGAQFKGLTAVAVPIVVVSCHMFLSNTWKRHLNLSNLLAAVFATIVYVAPFFYAKISAQNYGAEGLQLAFKENILRFFRAFDHKEPFYVYLYYVPLLCMPWFFFLAGFLADSLKNYKDLSKNDKWVLLSFLAIYILFTASSSRRSYYILPILPFASLGMAAFVIRPAKKWMSSLAISLQAFFLGCISTVGLINPVIFFLLKKHFDYIPPAGLSITLFFISALSSIFLIVWSYLHFFKEKTDFVSETSLLIMASYTIFSGFFGNIDCLLERDRPLKPFIMALKPLIEDVPTNHIVLSKNMASVAFYLERRQPIANLEHEKNVTSFLNKKDKKILITRAKDFRRLLPLLKGCKKELLLESSHPKWDRRADKRLSAWLIRGQCKD